MKNFFKAHIAYLIGIIALVAVVGFSMASCDNGGGSSGSSGGKNPTYYYETGGVSDTAYGYIYSNPGISAKQFRAYCLQYPVAGDIYREAESGYSRNQLENDLNQINVTGFSKTQFLQLLDSTGAVFQMFLLENGDKIYVYVEKE